MILRIVEWIKTHKLTVVLLLVVFYFVLQTSKSMFGINTMSYSIGGSESARSMAAPAVGSFSKDTFGSVTVPSLYAPAADYAPTPNVANRMVVQNSYLSLLVKDVVDVRKKIINYSSSAGGYMVNAETTNPQDAPTATVTVRIPSEKLDAALENFRNWGVKVVSENLIGTDVTDQYVDIDSRIVTLEKTKRSMEAILAQAVQISDLSNITREVINIQSQIDSLKGMQNSLSENAKLAKITVYLSTDEIALPYAPNETFRPEVIVKLAIRSLVTHLRALGALLIWVGIYSVIWVPVLVILYFLNKKFARRV